MNNTEEDFLPDNEGPLPQRLQQQTAMVLWKELERHFARGVVLQVDMTLDLVAVAADIVENNTKQVEAWMKSGKLGVLADNIAGQWATQQPVLWAVVAAPWVLVQENDAAKTYPGKKQKP